MASQSGTRSWSCDRCGGKQVYGAVLFKVVFDGYEEEWCEGCVKDHLRGAE